MELLITLSTQSRVDKKGFRVILLEPDERRLPEFDTDTSECQQKTRKELQTYGRDKIDEIVFRSVEYRGGGGQPQIR